jgi:hypothetical protein
MNPKMILMACCLLSVAVMSLASTSIGKECYDKNSSFANSKKDNGKYLTSMIIMGVLCIVASFGGMFMATKMP